MMENWCFERRRCGECDAGRFLELEMEGGRGNRIVCRMGGVRCRLWCMPGDYAGTAEADVRSRISLSLMLCGSVSRLHVCKSGRVSAGHRGRRGGGGGKTAGRKVWADTHLFSFSEGREIGWAGLGFRLGSDRG